MRLYVLCCCLVFCAMVSAQDAVTTSRTTANSTVFGTTADMEFEGKFYRLYTGFCSFEDAAKTAVKNGGTLVAPLSKAENDFIAEQLSRFVGGFFIGIAKNPAGVWVTPEGSNSTYQNWEEENSALSNENTRVMIKFDGANGKWVAVKSDAKASGFIVKFDQKPKPAPTVPTNSYGSEIQEENPTELETEEKTTIGAAPSELPGALSANSLYTNYLYYNGVFNPKLQDKTATISGLAQLSTIRKITDDDKLWSAYQGKYLMPILGDNIVCFFDELPDVGDAPWSIVKARGAIKRGPQFKQLVIENAYLSGHRAVKSRRRVVASKNDSYVQIFGRLNNAGNIIDDNMVGIQIGTENVLRQCQIGDDPEGYALEIYCLKLIGETENLAVGIIGVLVDAEDKEGPLTKCRIAGWADPSQMKRGAGAPPEKKEDIQPAAQPK